ncbi:MAG: hypothetical protein DMG10_27895 [Acidobacteria bacterium]|nr:MAG: hypothetical protein DMG10_27895 [Acidobacteriota bacterium]PYV39780.1 MAG: hypothetical protein DMG09_08320 [Acidobacteriota bacterium]
MENLITAAVLFSCVLGAALLAEKAPPLPKEVPTYPVVVPSRTHTVLRVSYEDSDPLAIRRGAPAWAPAAGRPHRAAPTVACTVFTCGHLHSQWRAAGSWKLRGEEDVRFD